MARVLILRGEPRGAKALAAGAAAAGHEVRRGRGNSADMAWCDVVVPLTVPEQLYLSLMYPEHAGRKFLLPSPEATRRLDDKRQAARFMAEAGFAAHAPLPRPGDRTIVKPAIGMGGELIFFGSAAPEGFMLDRAISGEVEFALHVLFDGSRAADAFCIRYARPSADYIKAGVSADGRSVPPDAGVVALVERILAAAGYQGWCSLNYIPEDGRPVFFEFNPRAGTSLCHAGGRMIHAYLSLLAPEALAGQAPPPWPEVSFAPRRRSALRRWLKALDRARRRRLRGF